MPLARPKGASLTAEIAERIREGYLNGAGRPARFLPSERELATSLGVARTTVRGALHILTEEGLVRPEHGRGYRTLPRAAGLKPGSAVAVAMPVERHRAADAGSRSESLVALQRELLERGWQALFLGVDWDRPAAAARQLVEARVWGAALNGGEAAAYRVVHQLGMPCVALDCADRDLPIDSIMQDNFGGARLAADYLLERGHRKVAWFGGVSTSNHSLERFAGASTAFNARGLELPRGYVVEAGPDRQAARALLGRRDRPTAVLCMWLGQTLAVAQAARALGLELGKDLEVVGWATEITYRNVLERELGTGEAPPCIVWNTAEMGRIAAERLSWHLREPRLKPLRISVPTRLVVSGDEL
jgi:DNA-binding LacI/PurR family transcriptional regulator